MKAIYLLGAPGVGKSAVMARLIEGYTPLEYARLLGVLRGHPLVDEHGEVSALYLGRLRPQFPGTDALSMSVHPDALTWVGQWTGRPFSTLFAEGQRLGTVGFLTALAERAETVVVHLTASDEVLNARRDARGSAQNAQWAKGSATKARRSADGASALGIPVVEVDAARPLADVVADVREAVR